MPIAMLKYIKIHKNTPTCFDLNRTSPGIMSVPTFQYKDKNDASLKPHLH